MYSLINKVSQENVIILGDSNYPELKWNELNSVLGEPFVSCIHDNFLEQVVETPTRNENFLDLVLTSEKSLVQNLNVG